MPLYVRASAEPARSAEELPTRSDERLPGVPDVGAEVPLFVRAQTRAARAEASDLGRAYDDVTPEDMGTADELAALGRGPDEDVYDFFDEQLDESAGGIPAEDVSSATQADDNAEPTHTVQPPTRPPHGRQAAAPEAAGPGGMRHDRHHRTHDASGTATRGGDHGGGHARGAHARGPVGADGRGRGGGQLERTRAPETEEPRETPKPTPEPQIGGITPKTIPPPPHMTDAEVQRVVARTHRRPDAHHEEVRTRLGQIASQAKTAQAEIVRQTHEQLVEVNTQFVGRALLSEDIVPTAKRHAAESYDGARGWVRRAAQQALHDLEGARGQASQDMVTVSGTLSQQIDRVLSVSSPAIRALHSEQLAVVHGKLDTWAQRFHTELDPKVMSVRNSAARSVTTDGDAVGLARAEAELRAWSQRAGQKADALQQSVDADATGIRNQEESFSVALLQLVNPTAVQQETVAAQDQSQVHDSQQHTTVRIRSDYERAVASVEQFRDAALHGLDQAESATMNELDAADRRLHLDLETREENLRWSIGDVGSRMADAYRTEMIATNASIDTHGLIEIDRVRPLFTAALRRLQEIFHRQTRDLGDTVTQAMATTDDAITQQQDMAQQLAASASESAWKLANEQVSSLTDAKDEFIAIVRAPVDAAQGHARVYTATVGERLGARPAQVRAKIDEMFIATDTRFVSVLSSENERLDGEVTNIETSLHGSLVADGLVMVDDLERRAQEAYNAMVGTGTEESRLFASLRNLTTKQGLALQQMWLSGYTIGSHGGGVQAIDDESLRGWLDDELSGDEYNAAIAYINGNSAAGAQYELNSDVHWYGNDTEDAERCLRDIARGGHLDELRNQPGWDSTLADLRGGLYGTDLDVINAFATATDPEQAIHRADALRLRDQIDAARRDQDNDGLNDLLAGIDPAELPAIRHEFAEIEGHDHTTPAQEQQYFVEYITRDREVLADPESGATQTVSLTGANRQLAVALASQSGRPDDIQSRVDIQAARMAVETSRGSADRERLAHAFQYDEEAETSEDLHSPDPHVRAAAEARRDQSRQVREQAMQQFAITQGGLRNATPEQARNYAAQAVRGLFDDDQGREFGESMVRDGWADPAVSIHLAVEGAGTDEDLIWRTLGRLDADQILRLRQDYGRRYGNGPDDLEALDRALGTGRFAETGDGDLSGDDRQRAQLMLRGRPRNDRERYQLELARTNQQQQETGPAGQAMLSGSREDRMLNSGATSLVDMVDGAGGIDRAFDANGRFIGEHPTENPVTHELEPSPEDAWRFRSAVQFNQFGVESYKAAIDRMTNILATVVAIAAAVVVSILIPGVGGAIAGAIIGGLLSMTTKAAMKGGRYGWEEAATDLAITAVDAITAGLTHGMGEAMRTAEPLAEGASFAARRSAGALAGLAERGAAGRATAWVASQAAENFVAAAPSALTASVLDENNWHHGNPISNILGNTVMQAGISTGAGLVMGGVMELGGHARASLRESSLRAHLEAGIPPDLRAQLRDVPIHELPAKQFEQITGSTSGRAVTVMTPEGPVVLVKQGAPASVLREEGIHLGQAHDPEMAGHVADLSESNLARWDQLPVSERLQLYRTKLIVEVDAQRRLIGDLEMEVSLAGPFERRGLARQLEAAETSLANLERRRIEVERFTPERIERVSAGEEPSPQYLDERPRLFNKEGVRPTGPDPMGEQRPVPATGEDRSPLVDRPGRPAGRVVEIGPRWTDGDSTYRLIGIVDESGQIVEGSLRQEIRSAHEDNRWVQRGSESNRQGRVAEEGSRAWSEVDVRPGWETHQGPSQWYESGGRGFDEVLLDFRGSGADMEARVRVVEVKDVGSLGLDDFTAIRPRSKGGNLEDNLEFVQSELEARGTLSREEGGYGLTEDQRNAALEALRNRQIDLELRLGPRASLGGYEGGQRVSQRGSIVDDLQAEWRRKGIRTEPTVRDIPPDHVRAGEQRVKAQEVARTRAAAEKPSGASGPASTVGAPRRVVLEPFAGPSVDSALDLMGRNPDAIVIATEARIMPSATELERLRSAGGIFVPDNMPAAIPIGSVDEIHLRFPLPEAEAVRQGFGDALSQITKEHPELGRAEQYALAVQRAQATAETFTNFGPYALQRLRAGGEIEVVFWEPQIQREIPNIEALRFMHPATGEVFRLEQVTSVTMRPRGEVAPHSGFGIADIADPASLVHVVRMRKVPLEGRIPTGARGPEMGGGVIGEFSGRWFRPDEAGGAVRELDWRRARITDPGIDIVEQHVRRFEGGGGAELAMVDRLRAIARGDIPVTDVDRRFYTHELREFVRYRRLGMPEGQPLSEDLARELWNAAHTATLEDYRLREGPGALFHPDIEAAATGSAPGGARGPTVEPPLRERMRSDLSRAGEAREQLEGLSDEALMARHAQLEQAGLRRRLRALRTQLPEAVRADFDALASSDWLRVVDHELADRMSRTLAVPVRIDTEHAPGAVRVAADSGALELRTAPDVTLADLMTHVASLPSFRRFESMAAGIESALAVVRGAVTEGRPLARGVASDAFHALQALPQKIAAQRTALLSDPLDSLTRVSVEHATEQLENEIARQIDVLGAAYHEQAAYDATVESLNMSDREAAAFEKRFRELRERGHELPLQQRLDEMRAWKRQQHSGSPWGFRDPTHFERFRGLVEDLLNKLFKKVSPKPEAFLQGSAVSGIAFERKVPFDHPKLSGETSDLDIALTSKYLFKRASVHLGLEIADNPARIGPLSDSDVASLGLGPLLKQMTRELTDEDGSERQIRFLLFRNEEAMLKPIGSSTETDRPAIPLRRE